MDHRSSLVLQLVKNPPAVRETWVLSLGQKDPKEKEMPVHSSILAWGSHGRRSQADYTAHGFAKSRT